MPCITRKTVGAGGWRIPFLLLAIIAMESTCTSAEDSTPHKSQGTSKGKTPEPTFLDRLQLLRGSYELTVEMKLVSKNETYIVREVRQRVSSAHGLRSNSTVIVEQEDVSKKVLHYYPKSSVILEEESDTCKQYGLTDYPLQYWGWLHEDQNTREIILGPSSILRSGVKHLLLNDAETTEGSKYEVWKSWNDGNTVEIFYYFPKPPKERPNIPTERGIVHGLPARFEINFTDRSDRIQYKVLSFLPYVAPATFKETRPKPACAEAIRNILRDLQLPKLPDEFSLDQEVMEYTYNGDSDPKGKIILNLHITHSESLGFTRLDSTPQNFDDTPRDIKGPLKVIKDYGSGFEYVINREFGNCSRYELPNNFLGYPLDPVALLRMDESFSFKGKSNARGIDCHLWTSSSAGIPDPDTDGQQSYPRVELELCFAKGRYNTLEGAEEIDIPIRSNLLIYSSSDAQKVQRKLTTNFYNFQLIQRHEEEVFSVSECLRELNKDSAISNSQISGYQKAYSKTVHNRDDSSHKAEEYGKIVLPGHPRVINDSNIDPDGRFTSGDMIGVALAMIILGIMMSGAFLVIIVLTGPKTLPEDMTNSSMVSMSFVNLKTAQGESES